MECCSEVEAKFMGGEAAIAASKEGESMTCSSTEKEVTYSPDIQILYQLSNKTNCC
jgi:hypothetical protein